MSQKWSPLTLPLPNPHQILIYIGILDLWVSFILNWISWIASELRQGKHLDLIKQGPIRYSEQLFWVGPACYSVVDKNASKKILIMKVTRWGTISHLLEWSRVMCTIWSRANMLFRSEESIRSQSRYRDCGFCIRGVVNRTKSISTMSQC